MARSRRLAAHPWLALVSLAAGQPLRAAVPLSIAESGHATVPVEIEGRGVFELVLDTGAEGTALYSPFEIDHALPLRAETTELQGQTGSAAVRLVDLPRLTVDGWRADHVAAVVLEPRADGVPLAGIIGLDVFGGGALEFDLPHGRAQFRASGTHFEGFRAEDAVAATPTTGGLLTFPVVSSSAAVSDVRFGSVLLASAAVLVADLPVFELFGVADRPAVIFGMDWLTETRLAVDFPAQQIWFARTRD